MKGSRTSITRRSSSRANSRTIRRPARAVTFQSTDRALSVGNIVAQGMKFVAASAKMTGHFSAQKRKNLVEMIGGRYTRIHEDFQLRIYATRFFEESEWETRADAECILTIAASMRKCKLDFLTC